MKKSIVTAIWSVLLLMTLTFHSFAQEISSINKGLDVIFIVDSSGSMKSNDPNGIAMDMVKAFIDTVHIENIRVGFVSYNDKIVSSSSPVRIDDVAERETLKALIDTSAYSGNTDIGLGLSYAHSLMGAEDGRNRIMVLISDGETDLGSQTTGRTTEQSNLEMEQTMQDCKSQNIPIYTIAFGKYDGSKAVLERIAENTQAAAYTAQNPEALIDVFYGIFGNNLSYKIQEVTNSVYARGNQEIRYLLDEKYLDELDLLLISPQIIGETTILYGEEPINTTSLSHYTVGKIREINPETNELMVKTATTEGQTLKAFLISYRSLVPVLEIENTAPRNGLVSYRVFFKDKNGNPILDEAFYRKFQWSITSGLQGTDEDLAKQDGPRIAEGVIQGGLIWNSSGNYRITGALSDNLGRYHFTGEVKVTNTPPSGSLPEERYSILTPEKTLDLDEFFRDSDGDSLQYSIDQGEDENATILLEGSQMMIKPKRAGIHPITLFVSDGEDTLAYPYQMKVLPLWQMYWWVIGLLLILISAILWKIFYKPKPELVQIVERKVQNRFGGKLDAYVTAQPENTEEIPPLTFPMHKLKTNKVSLGELLNGYTAVSEALELDGIFLIADEERRIILYHTSNALIMIGNSIVCRQLQYSIGFGDVIYITSPNGLYELEIHYISMIQ